MAKLATPSKVFDKKHIQMPEGNVVESDEEWDRCGKWILRSPPYTGMEFVDTAWTVLQKLLADGTLLMLKASTGLMAGTEGGLILCYTRPGKREAKQAAAAIQRLIDFNGIMYYKLNKQTSQGIANRFGDKNVAIYMQTFRGGFYCKKNGVWLKDDEDSGDKTAQIADRFRKENFSGEENLPSEHQKRCFWRVPAKHQCKQNGFAKWHVLCGYEDEGDYLPEVDRVWLVAKQLLQEGLFMGVTLVKFDDVPYAEVQLYVSPVCDVYSRLTTCNRIFKEASCSTVMHFLETKKRRSIVSEDQEEPIHGFLYTSDGELYGRAQFSEKYISG